MSNYDTIDITDCKLLNKELIDEVNARMSATQSIIIREYPYMLLVTKAQFKHLEDLAGGWQNMYGTEKDRIFKTDKGYLLEIKIKPSVK